jgi:hypothetical protein
MIQSSMVLRCDSCGTNFSVCYDSASTSFAEMRRDAREVGWSRRKLDSGLMRDLCPRCTTKAGKR